VDQQKLQPDEIFCAAIELASPAERAAYLDQVCGGDLDTRRRVERLLEAHSQAGSFLAARPAIVAATTDLPAEASGTVIGPYKLLQEIGEGGMGAVWLAEQARPVQRKVALKIIKAGMDSRQVLARFEAERQALALMDHPNIAKVLDAGATAAGRPFFVMELVKGQPITQYCDAHRLTPRQRLELFVPVCQAIQHAHQKGIIHRDIKPSNVLVAPYDGKPVIKVIDFGVAKATGQQLTEKTLFTELGAVVGTLEYMSPEQAELNNRDIDTRSDIYSLGVLLYELLTGSTPLDRKRLKGAALLELLRIIREEETQKPSTRLSTTEGLPSVAANRGLEPKKLSGLVRGELDWIAMKALEKDRNRRYETANSFGVDVQRYLADEPVTACPPSAGYRLRKFLRRKRRSLAAAALVLASLAVLAGSLAWMAWDRAARQRETEHGVVEALAQTEAYLDEGAKRMDNPLQWQMSVALAEGALRRAEGVLAAGRTTTELEQRVSLARDQVELARRESGLVIELERILLDTASGVVKLTAFDEPRAVSRYAALLRDYGVDLTAPTEAAARLRSSRLREVLLTAVHDWWRISVAVHGEETQRLEALLLAAEPSSASILNRWWAAVRKRDADALAQLAATPGVQDLPALAIRDLARALRGTGQLPAAERILREAIARYPGDFWLNHDLGMVLFNQKPPRAEQAVRYLTAAVALRNNSPGVYNNLGLALVAAKDVDGAIRAYQAALHIDPNYFGCYNNLASALLLKNDARAAISALETALKIDANQSSTHSTLSRALFLESDRDGAARELRAAIKLDPNNAAAHYNLGNLLWEAAFSGTKAVSYNADGIRVDKPKEPVEMLRQNKKDLNEAIVEFQAAIKHNKRLVEAHTNLGILYWQQGRFAESLEALRAAIKINPSHPIANCNLGNTLRDMNDLPGAIHAYQSAIRSNPKFALAHLRLGDVFSRQRRSAEAAAAYRNAIESDPNLVEAYLNLGKTLLFDMNDPEGAARAYQTVLKIAPKHASAQWNLGIAFRNQGRFTEALAALQKGQKLGVQLNDSSAGPAAIIRGVEQFIVLNAELVKLRSGEGRPANPREGLQLASLCVTYKRLYATGAAWYADAFAAEPKAADDINAAHRYDAACAAAQAGCGRGLDAGNLTDAERARLRKQAMEWLQADLRVYEKFLQGNNQQERTLGQQRLEHWQRDRDLSDVRDLAAIVKLPPGERAPWVKLWADIEIHLKSLGAKNE
jgi:serine/threonine protein kinase/tetratricopeptide (TPR) repeat protein